jgi:hypothetical protein
MNQAIFGELEQQRRDALVGWYLGQLVQQGDTPRRVLNENDLYEYLLIDNQVSAQVDTSRVAQGIASVQQHIHAIYNGMEPGYGAVSHDQQALWRDSMSQYSLWAGYQMLEDYPENYLDPALRLDKTAMFKTFEAELSQARLTGDSVHKALGNYLQAFETVSNLQVVSGYVDSTQFLDADYYLIGRQNIEPFAFYWRKVRAHEVPGKPARMSGWTEWKAVGSVSGAHIKHCRPVVMGGRLYVVWAESGKALFDETDEGVEKNGRFEYTLKLAYRRLDDSWSPPILLHTGEAPDELAQTALAESGALSHGYRLTVTTDHRNGGKSRMLVGFISAGFGSDNVVNYFALDEFLALLDADQEGVAAAVKYIGGEDTRRIQYCADEFDPGLKDQYTIASVDWDSATPPTESATGAYGINQYLVLNATWQSGKLGLQGVCNKEVIIKSGTQFLFKRNIEYSSLYGFRVSVYGGGGRTSFRVERYHRKGYVYNPVTLKFAHLGREVCVINPDDFDAPIDRGGYRYSLANKVSSDNPDTLIVSGADGGFTVDISDSQVWPLNASDNYYLPEFKPDVMNSGIAHFQNNWLLLDECVTLNGSAKTRVVYDDWPAAEPDERIYQWGAYPRDTDRKKFGLNGFVVKRAAVSAAAPNIVSTGLGAQYIGTLPGSPRIRLNTTFARELSRKASLSLESVLSWETQHTQEPLITGESAPVYIDFFGCNGLYFWELFFHTPHLVASRLQQEFDYAGAQQWLERLFNPQMRVAPLYPPPDSTQWLPYWTCRPLGMPDNPVVELQGLINPDAIARGAPSHYRKAIFMMYVNNLIAWGDMLYRQVTRDTLNEAKLLYVRALSLLGPLSKGRSIRRWSPATLIDAAMEGQDSFAGFESSIFQSLSDLPPVTSTNSPWLRLLDQSMFRLPVNSQLLDLWDSLDLRLHNLRHNLTLDGKPMHLALYEAPANPLDLLRAQLNGSSASQRRLGSLSIIGPYRFRAMLPRAQNAVDTMIRFSQQVLGHMESRDRAEQEELVQGQVLDDLASFAEQLQQSAIEESGKGLEVLQANRQAVAARKRYYDDQVLADVSALEKSAQQQRLLAMGTTVAAHAASAVGHLASLAPNLFGGATGGMHYGGPAFAEAEVLGAASTVLTELAQQQLTTDMQNRRREEWQHQAIQAQLELAVIDRQIEAQRIALSAAQKSLAQASKAREQAQALYAFIKSRTSGVGLSQWLLSQMSTLYFQAYDAVLSMCLSTEACWQYEIGDRDTRFISATAWVDNRFGLTAGETLKLGLLQMESAFLSRNERRLELNKTLSLKALLSDYDSASDSGALATGWPAVVETLRTRGEIQFELKSSTFDKDYPGHYLRQLLRLSVSLPVVLKPYQDIHATLSQQTSSYLLKPQIGNVKYLYQQAGEFPEGSDADIRQDQLVFNPRPNQQIGLSSGVDDDGMFMLDFGDERYFPFEGTGAISRWTLSFPNHEGEEQQAMFYTLTDVILHIGYLAVDGGKAFSAEVEALVENVEKQQARRQPISLT